MFYIERILLIICCLFFSMLAAELPDPPTLDLLDPYTCIETGNPCVCDSEQAKVLTLNDILERVFCHNLSIMEQYQNIENSMGIWKQQAGRFDANVFGRWSRIYQRNPFFIQDLEDGDPPLFIDDARARLATTNLEFSLERRLRNGMLIRPSVVIQRIANNFQIPKVQTTGQVILTFELPLLRNFGYENIGAGEIAAEISYRATILMFKNETAKIIATVGKAYWQYVYSAERLTTFIKAYERTKEFLAGLEKLIAAGEVAASEIHQVITDLETRRGNVERAELDLFTAKQAILILMNVDPEYYNCYKIYEKKIPFPSDEEIAKITCTVVDRWVQYALTQRTDYIAQNLFQDAALVLVNQAINALQPELNVTVDVSSQGLKDGSGLPPYYESFSHNAKGVNIRGTVILRSPLSYVFERGVLQSRRSEYRRLQAQTLQLLNTIKSDVFTRASGVKHYRAQLAAFTIAAREAEQAVIDEIRKFQLGVSTVFDIIQLKDRALNSELSLIDARLNFANVLIELRYFSGLILHPIDLTCHVDEDELVALPNITDFY